MYKKLAIKETILNQRWVLVTALVACFGVGFIKPLAAGEDIFSSAESKSAFAHKAEIIKRLFVVTSWPPNALPKDALTICLIGEFPYLKELTALNNQKALNRKIVVKKIDSDKKTDQHCQLIYVGNSEKMNAEKLINWYAQDPLILLSDISDFARKGGTMNFLLLNGKIALTANQAVLGKNHMKLDLNAFSSVTIIPDKNDVPEVGDDGGR